jgi:hypothetical protein
MRALIVTAGRPALRRRSAARKRRSRNEPLRAEGGTRAAKVVINYSRARLPCTFLSTISSDNKHGGIGHELCYFVVQFCTAVCKSHRSNFPDVQSTLQHYSKEIHDFNLVFMKECFN